MFFYAFLSSVSAQEKDCSLVISGYVLDEHSKEPLPFSSVQVLPKGKATAADDKGFFKIEGLCPGNYELICSHVGCSPVYQTIELNSNVEVNFYPEHHAEELNAVVIRGEKVKEVETLNTAVIKDEELLLTRGDPLGENLKEIPGMTSLNTGASISKPMLHGMTGQRLLIMNNGIRHEAQQWGNEHAPELDPFVSTELSVIKGPQGVRYGPDAIAGVVRVDPSELPTLPGLKADINLIGNSNGRQGIASATLEGALKKINGLGYRIQGTLKRGGNFHTPDYYLDNTAMREYNFSWGVGYFKKAAGIEFFYSQFNSDIGILRASHIGNLTDLQNAFEASQPRGKDEFTYDIARPWQHLEHELFKAKAYLRISEKNRLLFVFGRQYNLRDEYDVPHLGRRDNTDPELSWEITTHTGELVFENNSSKGFFGKFGFMGMNQKNTYEGRFFIPNFTKTGAGLFALQSWKKGRWLFEAGARYDYYDQKVYLWEGDSLLEPEYTFQNFTLSAGANYQFNPNLKLFLNIGSAWRPPYVNEMFSDGVHHGSASYEIGNPNLTEEKSLQFTLGGEWTSQRVFISSEAYYTDFQNYIYLKPHKPPTLTIRGAFPTFIYDQVPAVYYGWDFLGRFDLSKQFEWTVKASIVRAYEKENSEFLVFIPADRLETEIRFKVPNLEKEKNTFIGLGAQLVAKQWRVNPEVDYVPPPEAYQLVFLKAGTRLWMGKQPLNLVLRVNNLLNTRYRDYLNRYRYFADDLGRNISLKINLPINFTNN